MQTTITFGLIGSSPQSVGTTASAINDFSCCRQACYVDEHAVIVRCANEGADRLTTEARRTRNRQPNTETRKLTPRMTGASVCSQLLLGAH